MAVKVKTRLLGHIVLAGIILLGYNNCSKPGRGTGMTSNSMSSSLAPTDSSSSSSGLSGDACDEQLMTFYSQNYHPFLVQNCASCHSKGPGQGQFANSDLSVAFKDFMQIGYSSVSNYAVSDHAPRPSLQEDVQTINSLRISWVGALAENDTCKGAKTTAPTTTTNNTATLKERSHFSLPLKDIPNLADNEEQRMEYNLETELTSALGDPVPDLAGAKFSVKIKKEVKGTNSYYTVYSPRIYNAKEDIHIKSIFAKINGRYVNYSTNFRFVDTSILKNIQESDSGSLVSTGALIIAGAISVDDQLSFDFESIETTVIPPPPSPVQISFASNQPVLANETGEIIFEVKLDKPAAEPVSFTVSADNTPLCAAPVNGYAAMNATNCLPLIKNLMCPSGNCNSEFLKMGLARSVVGTTYNRFDWDYKFESSSMVFAIGETSKIFKIITSKDIRFENNRLLTLKIDKGIGTSTLGVSQFQVAFNKQKNPVPAVTEVTFSKLMNSNNGTFMVNCQNCHNSKPSEQQGGFDLADYDLMKAKGILAPGADKKIVDPVTGATSKIYVSKLFKRMNSQDPDAGSYISPMPRDKYLDYDTGISYVEKWILNGAKNN
jgi:hypothetical protein